MLSLWQAIAVFKILLSACLLIVNSVVCVSILSDSLLRKRAVFVLLLFLFVGDLFDMFAKMTYDFPSEFLGRPIVSCPLSSIWSFIYSIVWFSSILLHPSLAVIHLFIAIQPVTIKYFRIRVAVCMGVFSYVLAILMALPYLFTCANYFDVQAYTWKIDWSDRVVGFVEKFNYIIQLVCISITLFLAMVILQKENRRRRTNKIVHPSALLPHSFPTNRLTVGSSNSNRLVFNFLCLCVILFFSTVVFNVGTRIDHPLVRLAACISPFVRNGKALLYLLVSPIVRSAVGKTLRCCSKE